MTRPRMLILLICIACAALAALSSAASAATYHYCSSCYLAWPSEREGPVRHSYTLNYGNNLSGGWIGTRAHNSSHQSYGLNAQSWGTSMHSYSGSVLLFMIVNNIYDNGVGNGYGIYANAHGNY